MSFYLVIWTNIYFKRKKYEFAISIILLYGK